MSREKRALATLRFTGARFEDHGLDLDVLPELTAYKKLLVETAKEVWRRRHPGRQRLPRGFDSGASIKFFELEDGSTAVPLMREIEVPADLLLPLTDTTDEIDEAVSLLSEAIDRAGRGQPAPADLPNVVVPLFDAFGQTLRDDESIVLSSSRRPSPARYDGRVRERILGWIEPVYQDQVDFTGEVRSTDLDGASFTIRLDDGRKVRGPFAPAQERTILDALGDHESRRLRVQGTGEFIQADGSLKRLVSIEAITLVEPNGHGEGSERPDSLLNMIAEISSGVPDEIWRTVPQDLARNLDHYLYGRKRDDE